MRTARLSDQPCSVHYPAVHLKKACVHNHSMPRLGLYQGMPCCVTCLWAVSTHAQGHNACSQAHSSSLVQETGAHIKSSCGLHEAQVAVRQLQVGIMASLRHPSALSAQIPCNKPLACSLLHTLSCHDRHSSTASIRYSAAISCFLQACSPAAVLSCRITARDP